MLNFVAHAAQMRWASYADMMYIEHEVEAFHSFILLVIVCGVAAYLAIPTKRGKRPDVQKTMGLKRPKEFRF